MANPSLQHRINQSAVFHYLREHGPSYKKQIAQALEISLPSVTRALNALIERGFTECAEYRKNNQSRTVPYYRITIQNGIIVAMDILKGTICGRNLLEMFAIEQFKFASGVPLIESISGIIREYVEKTLGRDVADIQSICIGLPGIVNVHTGEVEKAIYHPDLEHIPIRESLSEIHHCPVFVDNVVNLAVFANYCEYDKEHGNIVACDIGLEIGAGLIIDHSIYRGQNHIAGETGFFINDLSNPSLNYKKTCTFRSLNKQLKETRILGDQYTEGSCEDDEVACLQNVSRLFELAHDGNSSALEMLQEYIVKIILMLNKVEILLNPKKIIIGGDVCCLPYSQEVFLRPLNALYSPVRQMDDPVCYSEYGTHVTIYGACEMGLETYLSEEFLYMMKEITPVTG